FMEHEKGLMEEITQLRSQAKAGVGSRDSDAVAQHLAKESELQTMMGRFFVQVENYPQLKSDATMLQSQRTYNEVEENIAAARRFYNAAVNSLNTSIQIFPGSLFAGMAGVTAYPFYEAAEGTRGAVDADAFLRRTA